MSEEKKQETSEESYLEYVSDEESIEVYDSEEDELDDDSKQSLRSSKKFAKSER